MVHCCAPFSALKSASAFDMAVPSQAAGLPTSDRGDEGGLISVPYSLSEGSGRPIGLGCSKEDVESCLIKRSLPYTMQKMSTPYNNNKTKKICAINESQ